MLDILYNAVIIIVLVVLIRGLLISPFRVIGSSMADTLHNNEFILIDKLSYHLGEPKRGDPIVFLPPITNKNSFKFKEMIVTDANGVGTLDVSDLRVQKKVFYCQTNLIKLFWFCQDKVMENDFIYYAPITGAKDGGSVELNSKEAKKQIVSSDEVKQKKVTIHANPNQPYLLQFYSATGPDFFVKRIIGIPGDSIRLENGRVYLKTPESDDFVELDEAYLSERNKFNTYFKKNLDSNVFEITEGSYFVLGDNRTHSNDSRHWFSPIDENYSPFVSQESINGRVLVVLWPPNDFRFISAAVLED